MKLMKPLLLAPCKLTKSIRKYAKIAGDHRNKLHFCSRKEANEIGDIACEPSGFAHPIFDVSWPALLRMHEKLAHGSGSSGVSINGGTPKWMIWNGKSYLVPLNPLVYYVFIIFRIEMTILEATPHFQTNPSRRQWLASENHDLHKVHVLINIHWRGTGLLRLNGHLHRTCLTQVALAPVVGPGMWDKFFCQDVSNLVPPQIACLILKTTLTCA